MGRPRASPAAARPAKAGPRPRRAPQQGGGSTSASWPPSVAQSHLQGKRRGPGSTAPSERGSDRSLYILFIRGQNMTSGGSSMSISDQVREVLRGIGEDPEREGLLKTPERVEKALKFLTQG